MLLEILNLLNFVLVYMGGCAFPYENWNRKGVTQSLHPKYMHYVFFFFVWRDLIHFYKIWVIRTFWTNPQNNYVSLYLSHWSLVTTILHYKVLYLIYIMDLIHYLVEGFSSTVFINTILCPIKNRRRLTRFSWILMYASNRDMPVGRDGN